MSLRCSSDVRLLREHWLSTKLISIPPHNFERDTSCGLCRDLPIPELVKTPCDHGHLFHESCIRECLGQVGNNRCPVCNLQLFRLSPSEDSGPDENRETAVAKAIDKSGLNSPEWKDYSDQMTGITNLDFIRAKSRAIQFLTDSEPWSLDALGVSGSVIIDAKQLAASFVVMKQLIPALSAVQDHAYDGTEQANWEEVVDRLWRLVDKQKMKKYDDALRVPVKLRKDVMHAMRNIVMRDYMTPFWERSPNSAPTHHYKDFDTLLRFLTFVSWENQRREATMMASPGVGSAGNTPKRRSMSPWKRA